MYFFSKNKEKSIIRTFIINLQMFHFILVYILIVGLPTQN